MQRFTAICFVGFFVSGCVSYGGGYPMDWARPVEAGGDRCPNFDGDFLNSGEMYHQKFGTDYLEKTVSLAQLLYAWTDKDDQRLDLTPHDPTSDDYRSVKLQLAGENLRVVVSRIDGGFNSFDIPVRLNCEDSMIQLDANWNGDTILLLSMIDRSSLALGRAMDGSLLVRANSKTSYLLTYWPMYSSSDSRWIRFPAFEPALADADASSPSE